MDDHKNEIRNFMKDEEPPHRLQDSIVKALKSEKLIDNTHYMKHERFFWIAATLAGIAIGFFLHAQLQFKQTAEPTTNMKPLQFIMLLHEDEKFDPGTTEISALVNEYKNWATELREAGNLVYAEKLSDEIIPFGELTTTAQKVTGYFVIATTSVEEAEKLVRSHPHLKYKGSIELRPIENTN